MDVWSEFVDGWCWIAIGFLPILLAEYEYSIISSKTPMIGFYTWYLVHTDEVHFLSKVVWCAIVMIKTLIEKKKYLSQILRITYKFC